MQQPFSLAVDTGRPVGDIVTRGYLSMVRTVLGLLGWLMAEPVRVLPVLVLCGVQAVYAQGSLETQQETNEKIEQLAELARTQATDVPVGSGDLLHIDVYDVPELSRDVRVSGNGDITYPLIPGEIHVAGLTPFQLQEKMEQLLITNGLITHPQVFVFVKEQNSRPVIITGAVGHATTYQEIRTTTLLEALTAAGGISNDAGSVIVITRPARPDSAQMEPASDRDDTSRDYQTITIRLQDLLKSGNPVYNIPVYSGDIVNVPRAGTVYVLGLGAAQPGGYILQNWGEEVTILQMVALAHGLSPFAKADDSVIMRTNPATGQRDLIPVHVQQILKHKANDVALRSNDILYIPDSATKKILAKGAAAALGIGTSVALYRATAP
jgi:polysaccharide biosynthesis/export protein